MDENSRHSSKNMDSKIESCVSLDTVSPNRQRRLGRSIFRAHITRLIISLFNHPFSFAALLLYFLEHCGQMRPAEADNDR